MSHDTKEPDAKAAADNEMVMILLKDYETMREEIRLYIGKFYLGLSAIFAILSAGAFQNSPDHGSFLYLLTPFIIAGLVGFMSMVTFYVNKVAGYIRFLEWRLCAEYGCSLPSDKKRRSLSKLAPILWESFYADIGMDRDVGRQLKAIHGKAFIMMILPVLVIISAAIMGGYNEAKKWQFVCSPELALGWPYVIFASLTVAVSFYIFWFVNTRTRAVTVSVNDELKGEYQNEQVEVKK
ncbi:MAG: hypothetical protein WC855_07100 [Thermodesulfovibrionales bacterium]